MAAFVLIHGAFTGGWIWQRMASALSGLGHNCLRPTLTGCGDRSHLLRPEISLSWHVEDVAQTLFHEDMERVVLVGHGYGSMIAAAVAHRHGGKVAGVVHLDGVLPERGQSYQQITGRGGRKASGRADGADWLIPPPTAESLGVACQELGRWLSVRLQPFPRACLEAPYTYGNRDRQLPGVFVRTTGREDQPLNAHVRAQAARAALSNMPVLEVPLGPLPMIISPGKLARTLASVALEMEPASPPEPRRRVKPVRCRAHSEMRDGDRT